MSGQWLHCEVKNKFIKVHLFGNSINEKILDNDLTLRLAYLIISSKCLLQLSLQAYSRVWDNFRQFKAL